VRPVSRRDLAVVAIGLALAAWLVAWQGRLLPPPLLLGIGAAEPPALRAEHAAMVEACRGAGVLVESFEVPGASHMGLVMQMGSRRDQVTEVVELFVRRAT